MTKEEKGKVEEIRERERAATAGPWRFYFSESPITRRLLQDGNGYVFGELDDTENARFAASSRQDIPFLLDLTHRLDVTCRLLAEALAEPQSDVPRCSWCIGEHIGWNDVNHEPDCVVTAAKKVLNEE